MDYRVLVVPNWANAGIRELQFYGHGFLPQVTLTSVPIELGTNPRVLSTISWEAETPTGTQIRLRTRTGNTLKQDIRYFTTTGLEVTKEKVSKVTELPAGRLNCNSYSRRGLEPVECTLFGFQCLSNFTKPTPLLNGRSSLKFG